MVEETYISPSLAYSAQPHKVVPTAQPARKSPYQRFREQLDRVQPFSLILQACAVGVITGIGAIAFAELIHLVEWLALGSDTLPLHILPDLPWYRILLIPTLGGLLVAPLVLIAAREAGGHGVPEVIESVALGGGKIQPRVAIVKSLASALTIGTGGSVGREGPIVHIGASLGSALGQLLRVSSNRLPTLAGCGVAGGIAAAFNAPIAGAFFALEVVMGNFAMPAFGPVMLSSVLATVVSRTYFGDHPAFTVPGYTLLSSWELPLYVLLGVVCGIGGQLFMTVLHTAENIFPKLPLPNFLKPAVGGLLLGGLVLLVPHVYGAGHGTLEAILRGSIPWPLLLLLLPMKMVATSLTLASGGSGGLLLPALYLGAIIGGLLGTAAEALVPSLVGPSGGYALVGMAALLAGVVHCPITAFLLLFELTSDYHIILPLMISCPVSTLVSKLIKEESIYTLQLLTRGVDIRRREENIMRAFHVGQIMRREVPSLLETAPFPDVVQYFLASTFPVCFVVDVQQQLVGVISIHDVKAILQEDSLGPLVIAQDLIQTVEATTTIDEPLASCVEKFSRAEQEYLPVVSPGKRLCGILSHRDVLDLYQREILRNEYLGVSLQADGISSTMHEHVRLPHHYTVDILQLPSRYIGQTLRDTQLRTDFGLTAVAIRRGGFQGPDELPDPDQPLAALDHLVLVGRQEDLQRFAQASHVTTQSVGP